MPACLTRMQATKPWNPKIVSPTRLSAHPHRLRREKTSGSSESSAKKFRNLEITHQRHTNLVFLTMPVPSRASPNSEKGPGTVCGLEVALASCMCFMDVQRERGRKKIGDDALALGFLAKRGLSHAETKNKQESNS